MSKGLSLLEANARAEATAAAWVQRTGVRRVRSRLVKILVTYYRQCADEPSDEFVGMLAEEQLKRMAE